MCGFFKEKFIDGIYLSIIFNYPVMIFQMAFKLIFICFSSTDIVFIMWTLCVLALILQ